MLNLMRQHAKSWWIKTLLIVVALSFVIGFGILSSLETETKTYVAIVGDHTIDYEDLSQAIRKYYEENREYLGDDMTDEEVQEIENLVLNNIIYEILETTEARRLNIPVSNDEVRDEIYRTPYFLDENMGGFNYELYSYLLRANGLTEQEYEAIVREEILLTKFRSLIKDSVCISDEEILMYVIAMVKDITSLDELTPDERENYYKLTLSIKRIDFYNQFILNLYKNTDIEINSEMF